MTKNDAYARCAKAYGRCGYSIKSIRIHRPTLIFWTVDAAIVRDGKTFSSTADGLTLERLVRNVERTYAVPHIGGPT